MESMKISHMDNVETIWIGKLPSNAFTKLKMLKVEYCEKLSCIFSSHTIITRFQNLEELIVTDCSSLEVVFHIKEFSSSEAHSTSSFQLTKLVLTRLPKMKHVWSGLPQETLTFGCLRSVQAFECEGLKSLFPNWVAKSMTQLTDLHVRNCGVEEIIAEEDGGVGTSANDLFFPTLFVLRLFELPLLRNFYKNSHTSTWPHLKVLRVRNCNKMRSFSFACEVQSKNQPALFFVEKVVPHLKRLTLTKADVMMMKHDIPSNLIELALACYDDENVAFPSNFVLQRFPNLKELAVEWSSFEEIFPEDVFGHGGATPYAGLTDTRKPLKPLGKLKRLWLIRLNNLKRVWKDGSLMVEILKHIGSLFVWSCPSLSIIFPSPTSFESLTELEVVKCQGLVHMGTCSAVISLVHLTQLILRDCHAVEDVVTDDANGVEEISFPKLEKIVLDRLPSLESFSPTNCAFMFPALVWITVTQCPKMNIFCKGAVKTPNLDKVNRSYNEDEESPWEGDLNTTIQTLSI